MLERINKLIKNEINIKKEIFIFSAVIFFFRIKYIFVCYTVWAN
jgi:hypothetical protein